MSTLSARLCATAVDLDAVGARWALVGALAISARAEPRLTRDIDVAVSVAGDEEAERTLQGLCARGHELSTLVECPAGDRLACARLTHPDAPMLLDLLFASSGIEAEIVAAAERIEIVPGLSVAVARTPHLIALKLLCRDDGKRPQDSEDLRALLAVAKPADVVEAWAAARLIEARGMHRGRDLVTDLESLVRPR